MPACKINTDANQPVAIEILLPDSGRVEVTDTLRPSGLALNGFGDSVKAPLIWYSLDTTLAVLDSTTGASLATAIGSGRLEARTGNLFSNPEAVSILARLDSIRAAGPVRDTVFVTPVPPDTGVDSLSDTLRVQAYAFGGGGGGGGTVVPSGRRVVFTASVFPASGPVVTLSPRDTVLTDLSGQATTQVRLHRPGPVPDSVVVTATMLHVSGTPVDGSPVTFVVEFRP